MRLLQRQGDHNDVALTLKTKEEDDDDDNFVLRFL